MTAVPSMVLAALSLALLAVPLAALEPVLAAGERVEARVDGDFDGNGTRDLAYIAASDDKRALHVVLADNGAEFLPLETTSLGPGTLAFAKGVLVFEDLTGGTSALATTRRYRFDKPANRMRLIGLDATHYSRTYVHDGFELSWNLLTGKLITRELHLNRTGGEAAYDPIVERRTVRRSGKVWLFDTPDVEAIMNGARTGT